MRRATRPKPSGPSSKKTVGRGGTVVIPAFAVGRAQLLPYYLWKLRQAGRLGSVPIYLDSPMAINASELLCDHLADHRLPAEIRHAACGIATYTREVEESKRITASQFPKVVISASGMATGGRVLHHLAAFAPKRENTILFKPAIRLPGLAAKPCCRARARSGSTGNGCR